MTARILLVTGSRVLEGSESEAEAQAILHAVAASFLPMIVVAGDAHGPDCWAIDWAVSSSVDARVYCLDRRVLTPAGEALRQWTYAERLTPIDRNEAMVREVAAQARKGSLVRVLGLVAEWSATRGTEHTLRCARSEGLGVTRVTFSAEKLTT